MVFYFSVHGDRQKNKIYLQRCNKEVFAAVLTDLFKDIKFVPHGLLIAKLNAVGYDKILLSSIFCLSPLKKTKKLHQNLVIS